MPDADPVFDEMLARRRLEVLNAAEPAPPGEYVLEGEGFDPRPRDAASLRDTIVAALRTVHDPEIPLNIYDLGLIYRLDVSDDGVVAVAMTLTAPGCPVAGPLVGEVHERVLATPGVRRARTELVWDPPWTQERLSEAARLELGLL
jgi:FeS assembly SUF system protein